MFSCFGFFKTNGNSPGYPGILWVNRKEIQDIIRWKEWLVKCAVWTERILKRTGKMCEDWWETSCHRSAEGEYGVLLWFRRFCEKEKCSVYFRMNGFSRIREEKKKVIWRRKKQLDQRGLPVYFQMVPVLDVWNNFMAKDLGVSKYVLSRVFSKIFHRNFNQYLNDARLGYAKQRLETTNDPITTIWLDSGFESQRIFNRVFKEKYKVSPNEYRRTLYENLGEKMK